MGNDAWTSLRFPTRATRTGKYDWGGTSTSLTMPPAVCARDSSGVPKAYPAPPPLSNDYQRRHWVTFERPSQELRSR
eukprot:8681916-Lingulodinium_polyedra.AAC.1